MRIKIILIIILVFNFSYGQSSYEANYNCRYYSESIFSNKDIILNVYKEQNDLDKELLLMVIDFNIKVNNDYMYIKAKINQENSLIPLDENNLEEIYIIDLQKSILYNVKKDKFYTTNIDNKLHTMKEMEGIKEMEILGKKAYVKLNTTIPNNIMPFFIMNPKKEGGIEYLFYEHTFYQLKEWSKSDNTLNYREKFVNAPSSSEIPSFNFFK